MTTEGKRTGKTTALDYFQKNTGVFNDTGMLGQEQVEAMKERAKKNKGNIFHGFISLSEIESDKIDTPEKCIELIKRVFPSFLQDAKFDRKNIDLMCALHKDRPHHLHIHFVFWEKEPKYKGANGTKLYRSKGKIDKDAIDNMFIRLGEFLDDKKSNVYMSRDEAIKALKSITSFKSIITNDDIVKDIIKLSKDLPEERDRLFYNSKEMDEYRERVDDIVRKMLSYDGRARKTNRKFYKAVAERERLLTNICGDRTFIFSDDKVSIADLEKDLPKYHNKIDVDKALKMINDLKADYMRRQGNLVLNLAKNIKPEYYEQRKFHTNDIRLKRMVGMARDKTRRTVKKFIRSFGQESELLERDYSHRLREIEEEMENEKKKNEKGGDYKD